MKPNFALNFTDDAIVLLHRTARGWLDIGQTPFGAPDMAEALGYLRASALGLSPQGMTTKVVIPNGQILYTEVEAPGPDTASRKAQIRAALEGRTPYPVDDLVFDWWGKGPRLQVAVVARETLEEAEAFAVEHRLNPVSFVAMPEQGRFVGEPFFGKTQAAAKLLASGESVTRDQDPIQIVAREVPRDEPVPAAPKPEAAAPSPAPKDAAPAPKVAQSAAPAEPAQAEAPAPAAAPATPAAEKPAPQAPVTPAAETARAEPPAAPIAAPPREPAAPPVAERPAPAAAERPGPPAATRAPAPDLAPPQAAPAATPAPAFSSRRRDDIAQVPPLGAATRSMPPAPTPPAPPKTTPPAPTDPAPVAQADAPKAAVPSVLGAALAEGPIPAPAAQAAVAAAPAAPAEQKAPAAPVRAQAPVEDATAAARTAEPKPAAAKPETRPETKPDAKPLAKPVAPTPPRPGIVERPAARSKPIAAMVTAASIPGLRSAAKPAASASKDAAKPAKPATDPLAMRAARPGGKPKYLGLVLTGILLVFLALVAAWSSFYLSSDEGATDDAEIQTATAPAPADGGSIVAPNAVNLEAEAVDPDLTTDIAAANAPQPAAAPLPEAPLQAEAPLPEAQTPAPGLPAPGLPPAVVAGAETPATPAPAAEPAAAPLAAADPATAAPVVPDLAPAAPAPDATAQVDDNRMVAPGPLGQDEILLAGLDAPPPAFDAVALPVPLASADAPPAPVVPPPPPGAIYEFDAEGRIIPTERGVVTPSGFWLIAARPDPLPPPRPAGLGAPAAAEPTATAPEAAATAPEAETLAGTDAAVLPAAEEAVEIDPAFTAIRPRGRPADLAPPPAAAEPAQAQDDAGLIPPTDPRFAAVRPRVRPASVATRADEARMASEAASLAVATALAEPAVQPGWDANASPLAVALSRRPAARPADLSRAVEAAAAAAVRPQEGPALDPEEEEEPEIAAAAAPRIPTRASVAKQATFTNAINLSRLNLIGIYGTPSNRSALVRSSNGRYTKVEVGDRLDGGRVRAITASELRYEKGGRMLVLEMPRG